MAANQRTGYSFAMTSLPRPQAATNAPGHTAGDPLPRDYASPPAPHSGKAGHDSLAHIPLFSGLEPAERKMLFDSMHVVGLEANQTIFWRGDGGDSLYVINQGRVSITVPNEQGEHVVLDYL